MLKNEDIICISSIDWDFIWQGHQEIMTRLARNGNRVLYIENTGVRAPRMSDIGRIRKRIANWRKGVHGIRKIEDGLYVYSPIILPFPYLRLARIINKKLIFSVLFKWLKTVGFSEPIVWTFLPTGLTIDLIDKIEPKAIVYYCIDSFKASSADASKIKRTEEALLKKADLVFATSEELLRYCRQHNDNVHLFPFGVSIENFQKALREDGGMPSDMRDISRPIAGYIGGIHKWIDFDLVESLARSNDRISFVFCGPVQSDVSRFAGIKNVIFLGQKKAEELPMYVKQFDVAMIPYRITEYTNNVYPTKLNEYLSIGKRVVSTGLIEVKKFNNENGNIVSIAGDAGAFSDSVRRAVKDAPDPGERDAAMRAAGKNSWTVRLEDMSRMLEAVVAEKAIARERSWKTNLAYMYKKTAGKLAPAIAAIALGYIVIFHTPLIWSIAKPLELKDAPRPADVIAVLGGGVGESGKAGDGYQERVHSAVKMYNEKLSSNILYMSGYMYFMKEAYVMRTLSVDMGVKPDDIIIDDTPVSTYDMVMDLKKLIRSHNWKSAILISSPYHMLRLKLLCDKQLSGVRIYYVPVESSSYYARGSSVSLKQMTGIIKEYVAILYYKLKRYM
jgi:uncharacterized SAM-binding protein YcdF (DUF218 family)/glycosyltransferase involved in cell wall biosynthesis